MQIPLPELKDFAVSVEVLHVWDKDDVLWLDFTRQVQDEHGGVIDVACLFSREVPQELNSIRRSLWWALDEGDLAVYFAALEAMPEFQQCLDLEDWQLENYLSACRSAKSVIFYS